MIYYRARSLDQNQTVTQLASTDNYLSQRGNTDRRVNSLINSALDEAVRHTCIATASLLLERKASPNYVLSTAALYGNTIMMRVLLDAKADTSYGLDTAFRNGYLDAVKLLFHHKANIDNASISCAAIGGNVDIINFLIEHGADIHENGEEPLICAINYGNVDVIRFLLQARAIPRDIMLTKIGERNTKEITKLLLDAGLDLHYKDDKALHNAVGDADVTLAQILLENGADSDTVSNKQVRDAGPEMVELFRKYRKPL